MATEEPYWRQTLVQHGKDLKIEDKELKEDTAILSRSAIQASGMVVCGRNCQATSSRMRTSIIIAVFAVISGLSLNGKGQPATNNHDFTEWRC